MNTLPPSSEQTQKTFTDENGNSFIKINNFQDLMFTVLSKKPETITPGEFIIQANEAREKREQREAKEKILAEKMKISPEQAATRPELLDVNLENLDEILNYAAKQNLACAFSCCGDEETAEHVEEIIAILQKNHKKFVHFSLYEDKNWEKLKSENPQYASQFFEVSLHENPQNETEKNFFLKEFREVFNNKKS